MAIPDFQSCMLPILKLLSDRNERSLSEFVEMIEKEFDLTDEEKAVRNDSGQRTIYNRTAWACTYLKRYGLLQSPKRGSYTITDKGIEILNTSPSKITKKLLIGSQDESPDIENDDLVRPPDEIISELTNELNNQLANDILDLIYVNSPAFFEKLVIDLLISMGYGGFDGSGQTVGQSGDGGIDGIIKQDVLGLDSIYIQAKRWDREKTVGRPEIQKFVGALAGQNASKGVFITTSKYAENAKRYAENLPNSKLVLIDGIELTRLMIEYDLGVSVTRAYHIKRIDSDYFESS
jgi:restriction system protein